MLLLGVIEVPPDVHDWTIVSDHLNIDKISVNIITTPLTDHNAVSIFIPLHSAPSTRCKNAYWKLNSSLLQHDVVKIRHKKTNIGILE